MRCPVVIHAIIQSPTPHVYLTNDKPSNSEDNFLAFATALDRSTKPITCQNIGDPLENRTRAANVPMANRNLQPLAKVRLGKYGLFS
jgi:hypothetical protein